jgi:hypothetical protein
MILLSIWVTLWSSYSTNRVLGDDSSEEFLSTNKWNSKKIAQVMPANDGIPQREGMIMITNSMNSSVREVAS